MEKIKIEDVKFDNNGLIPAIVVDASTGKVLTLAYMNEESLKITIKEGRTCFWSRSRKELWRKGETSGNVQHVRNILADCDRDALLVYVDKEGPACHLGNDSCFEFPLDYDFNSCDEDSTSAKGFNLDDLYELLESRRKEMPEGSYTTYLFEKGLDKILKKVGEECTEVIIAGKAEDKKETVYEIADLVYHVLVLMVEMGIDVDDIKEELASRKIIDKKTKQEKMT